MRAAGQERREEVSSKMSRVRGYLVEAGLDGVLLSRRDNFAWLTAGGDNHVVGTTERGVATLLIAKDAARIVATNIEMQRLLEEELSDLDVDPVVLPWHEDGLQGLLRIAGTLRVASDAPIPRVPLLGADFARLRFALLPSEAARYRVVGRRAVAAIEEVARAARSGDSETVLAGRLSEALMARGLTPTVLLVACDERIRRYRHPIPTDLPLTRHAMLVVMAMSGGLQVALTRLMHLGSLSDELRRRHNAVVAVDGALAVASRPGVKACDALAAGIAAYEREGYPDEWRLHHQGGPTGYAPREYVVTPSSTEVFLANQPVAWNPSITGTKSEDTFLVTADGPEYVTLSDWWPTLAVTVEDRTVHRPAILER